MTISCHPPPSLPLPHSSHRAAARTVLQSYYSQQGLESSSRSLRSVISQYAGRVVQSLPSLPRAVSIPTADSVADGAPSATVSVAHLTESLLEGVVGSFGRWIGAEKTSRKEPSAESNVFGDLRAALDQNEELLEAHRRKGMPLQSLSSSHPDPEIQNDGWDDW